MVERMKTLQQIIDFMEYTSEDSWSMDVVRTKDGKNCFFGHLFSMEDNDIDANKLWNWFENIATTYMIYPVNDGNDDRYPQETPKQRVIAYLKDLRDGKQKTTYELMDECEDQIRQEELLQKLHIQKP